MSYGSLTPMVEHLSGGGPDEPTTAAGKTVRFWLSTSAGARDFDGLGAIMKGGQRGASTSQVLAATTTIVLRRIFSTRRDPRYVNGILDQFISDGPGLSLRYRERDALARDMAAEMLFLRRPKRESTGRRRRDLLARARVMVDVANGAVRYSEMDWSDLGELVAVSERRANSGIGHNIRETEYSLRRCGGSAPQSTISRLLYAFAVGDVGPAKKTSLELQGLSASRAASELSVLNHAVSLVVDRRFPDDSAWQNLETLAAFVHGELIAQFPDSSVHVSSIESAIRASGERAIEAGHFEGRGLHVARHLFCAIVWDIGLLDREICEFLINVERDVGYLP